MQHHIPEDLHLQSHYFGVLLLVIPSVSCPLRTVFALAKGQTSQHDITPWPLVGVQPLA